MVYRSINLDELREEYANFSLRQPFQHQIDAFEALNKTFNSGKEKPGSGIVVLPTGAGKTFTAVRWLCNNIIPKNIKILWLAPSFYLLDQAFQTFYENARGIPETRSTLNMRCVSSNPSHARAASVMTTDDVLIMTVQTAISNLHTKALDGSGRPFQTAFRQFVESCRETGLFIVVDEAHHAPAHGCRNLLIGEKDTELGLRGLLPNAHLLGLTATPTYTDENRRGWLWKIFTDEVIYEAKKETLITQKILARPNYIEVSTGKEMQVDDKLYDRLVKQHRDLPEAIIEKLAADKNRNNFIVNTYVSRRSEFGKTIIFADRWFQCVYLKEKLLEMGIRADAIYSRIDAAPGSAEARNKRTQDDNKRILQQFKTGKDEHDKDAPLDVLINVRMLTEGADVPSVQTVFLTRQTTSSILMTQMIGRALRGEKTGGSGEANIVLFFDDWKRLIDWADPGKGATGSETTRTRGTYPLEYISIRLIEELTRWIDNDPPGVGSFQFSKIFPVGWYKTEIVYADSEEGQDSSDAFTEFVMVYEHTESKFRDLVEYLSDNELSDEWSKEYLNETWIQDQIEKQLPQLFDYEQDDVGDRLFSDITKIVRYMAQNQSPPPYHSFAERDQYDLDKLAEEVVSLNFSAARNYLQKKFEKTGTLWKTFYRNFNRFETGVHRAVTGILNRGMGEPPPPPLPPPSLGRELPDEEKRQVKKRDGYMCLCCGAKGMSVQLQVDHIKPYQFGGETTVENSQTLCNTCNGSNVKGTDEMNFRRCTTQLEALPPQLNLFSSVKSQDDICALTRIVNCFYRAKALREFKWYRGSNGQYTVWEICLYSGNNPEWLLRYKEELLSFVREKLRYRHVEEIKVTTGK